MNHLLNVTKALSDPTRLRLLMMLRYEELCLAQLIELLGLAPSTLSKHLSILSDAGLLKKRKDGRWCFYSTIKYTNDTHLIQIMSATFNSIAHDPQICDDARHVQRVRDIPLEELTACYKN